MTYFPTAQLTTKDIDAQNLFRAAEECNRRLVLGSGEDVTDLLRLHASGLTATTETLTGISNSGLQFTFKRIGRLMAEGDLKENEIGQLKGRRPVNREWNWIRMGEVKAFGLKRAVWTPGYESDDEIIYRPEALFNAEWEFNARNLYGLTDSCRDEDFDFHLGQLRGTFLGYRLAQYLKAQEQNFSARYQRQWIREWMDCPELAEARLCSELERAGVFA
ncbi:hypothetical protein SynBIOSU31_02084 [Synechococcus sp. BIOS-U3-1]|uniref:hypothetical protein n=1 Tax=Synechococcus sp. BIOS-U3-1 TaxID=1400865 RepID=UPI00164971D0|nr:hypothetical protein [Synechococcus sp. BIOS-U3-1]QNI58950.1 hypothetical protein SynBIOSU31_02084 [Synechococcus sp. BIOS-U3-1]